MTDLSIMETAPTTPPEEATRTNRKPLVAIADLIGIAVVLSVIVLLVSTFFVDGKRIIGQDWTVYYIPMFSFLGDQIGSGNLPGWNPHQYGGTPFAGDPESGWMYFPSMVIFAIFSLGAAVNVFLVFHYLLASFGTYLFSRVLGLNAYGATAASVAYITSNWFYRNQVSAPAYVQTVAWLPWAFLFVEASIRQKSLLRRVIYSGLASLAFGQIVAAWLGKGAYYALIVLGAYLVYQTLVGLGTAGWRERIWSLAVTGISMGLWTALLTAGGVLPRIEYQGLSNLQNGYQGFDADTGGGSLDVIPYRLLGMGGDSPTTIVVVLAIIALVIAGRRFAAPYFGLAITGILMLGADETRWFQAPFLILPEFEGIHRHWPHHMIMVAFLPFAMLAGIAVSTIFDRSVDRTRFLLAMFAPFALLLGLGVDATGFPESDRYATIAVGAIIVALVAWKGLPDLRLISAAAIVVLYMWPVLERTPTLRFSAVGPSMFADLDEYFAPSGAVEFIEGQSDVVGAESRYFGYDPSIGAQVGSFWVPYRRQFYDPRTTAIEVNNRATALGLYDIQGQNNPIQLKLYELLFTELNRAPQDYHEATVFEPGLDSPLLDLLSVRYIIIPISFEPTRTDYTTLIAKYPTVYQDASVRVLERTSSLPRAWIVHTTSSVDSTETALTLVGSGSIDPLQTAPIVGTGRLDSASPVDASSDSITLEQYEPNTIRYETSTSVDGQFVASEIEYAGWNAYVDGKKVDTQNAYGVFQSVFLPAGEHTVEFRFESNSLIWGTWISVVGYVGLAGLTVTEFGFLNRRRSS